MEVTIRFIRRVVALFVSAPLFHEDRRGCIFDHEYLHSPEKKHLFIIEAIDFQGAAF